MSTDAIKEIRLNLGCGPLRVEGEIGVDLFPGPACDVQADVRCLPFGNSTVDYARLDHVLEHIDKRLALGVLREAHRVLKRGGVIIVGVPDLEQTCRVYADAGNDIQLKVECMHSIYGGQTHPGEYHRSGYDPYTLRDILDAAGFRVESVEPDTSEWRIEGFCITAKGVKRDG